MTYSTNIFVSRKQNSKSKFRATSTWKKFRKSLKEERAIDCITLSKLYSGWNLHHKDLNDQHYTDLTNKDNFACLNKKTHEFIHWLYPYYKKDKTVLDRIEKLMEEMVVINN